MRLHKRTIRLAGGHKIIQLMTATGLVVAEFHDSALWNVFLSGARKPMPDISIFDEDIGVMLIATLDDLLAEAPVVPVHADAIRALEEAGMREAASLLRREGK